MQLSREEAFELWTNPSSAWSVWCKPVALSFLEAKITSNEDAPPSIALPWAPAADGTTIIVVDLPGVQSVHMGEALLRLGFRPILLFNAVPGNSGASVRDTGRAEPPRAAVDVYSTVEAIGQASLRLRARLELLPAIAPPAFLLDGDRRLGGQLRPGDFDNRSVSLPTDFPSATFLLAHGVTRAIVVFDSLSRFASGTQPATDLAHTLLRWQTAGISILSCPLDDGWQGTAPQPITVDRPSWFGAIWHNALSLVGLRRSPMGGFGGTLPVPSSG
ncbi:MAG TPA: hypothetical protein VER96_08185 [Polyangiaceae bacterium]|nr:hypothetical protein [Polyangiaceae bacterium]